MLCSAADLTATVDLSVTGGVPPYTYSWSNGANTEDVSDLGPGTYSVTVTDLLGATSSIVLDLTDLVTTSKSGKSSKCMSAYRPRTPKSSISLVGENLHSYTLFLFAHSQSNVRAGVCLRSIHS